jgi:hypothetical protein
MSSPYDLLTGTRSNPVGDDTDPNEQKFLQQTPISLSTDEDAANQESGWQKVGGVFKHILAGAAALDPNGSGGGRVGGRQSAASLLLKRQEDAQKQADWEQNYTLKQQEGQQKSRESAARLSSLQGARDDNQKDREFNQSRAAIEDYAGAKATTAPIPSLFTGAETDTGGNQKFVNSPGSVEPNTEGRPSYQAGGATMIPYSPQEKAKLTQDDKQNEFNARLADVAKTNPQFVKDHQNDIAAFQLFGKIPAEKQGDFTQDLMKDALTNPDPVGRKKSEDTYKAMVNLKKGIAEPRTPTMGVRSIRNGR